MKLFGSVRLRAAIRMCASWACFAPFLAGVIAVTPWVVAAQTKPLNDTGINFCGGAFGGNNAPCLAGDPAGQDRDYGRDGAARTGALPAKIGGSAGAVDGSPNGFDLTKIANNGTAISPSVGIGTGPTDWACTRDNVTGLVWEVKTTSGLRSQSHTYTWFQTGSLDGNNGTANGGSCATAGRCDTEKYVQDVSVTGLCGFSSGWRMPTSKELESIVDAGRYSPAIDPVYFPNTRTSMVLYVWSGSPYAGSSNSAWGVDFIDGSSSFYGRTASGLVRVVRGGQ